LGSNDRREREKQELRGKILDAARALFPERGYEAVTIRTIADAIEYSPRTIYLYFKDKEDLIRELCRVDFAQFGAGMGELLKVADPLERIKRIGAAYARFGAERPNHYRLMFMTTPPVHDHGPEAKEKGDPEQDAYALLYNTVQEAIDKGLLRPELSDTHLLVQVLWSGIHGVVALNTTHCIGIDDWVPWAALEQRVETMLDVLNRGLRR
jgi:AcrR family transcriptional regulator